VPDFLHFMPVLNASLNGLSGVWLLIAYVHIRRKNIAMHKRFMLTACATSLLFLISYLTYHAFVGTTRFAGQGWSRPVYFTILISHTILAIVIVPLAIVTVWNGLKMRVPRHRAIAQWTFPMWMYVSVTGVLVYFFLYQWFPSR
jgi:putative membrane protein